MCMVRYTNQLVTDSKIKQDGRGMLNYCIVEMSTSKIIYRIFLSCKNFQYQKKQLEVSYSKSWNTHRNMASNRRRISQGSNQAMAANLESHAKELQFVTRSTDWKRSIYTPTLKTGDLTEHANYCTISLVSQSQAK